MLGPCGRSADADGPSGVGKSTLLAFIGGFLGRDFSASGRILLNGRDVTALAAGAARHRAPLPGCAAAAAPLRRRQSPIGLAPAVKGRAARRRAVEDALAEVGLENFADRDPATLSGGQAARVALMRTLLARPQALILDEPFSRLDAALRGQVRELVLAEARKYGLPCCLSRTTRPTPQRQAGK